MLRTDGCWFFSAKGSGIWIKVGHTYMATFKGLGDDGRGFEPLVLAWVVQKDKANQTREIRGGIGHWGLPRMPHGDFWPPVARDLAYDSVQVQQSYRGQTGGHAEITLLSAGCMSACRCRGAPDTDRSSCSPPGCRPAVDRGCAPGIDVRTGWDPRRGKRCKCSTTESALNCADVARAPARGASHYLERDGEAVHVGHPPSRRLAPRAVEAVLRLLLAEESLLKPV